MPIWGRFMKKTRGKKSRATVPLSEERIQAYMGVKKHNLCVMRGSRGYTGSGRFIGWWFREDSTFLYGIERIV
jgi:hypothetical protein